MVRTFPWRLFRQAGIANSCFCPWWDVLAISFCYLAILPHKHNVSRKHLPIVSKFWKCPLPPNSTNLALENATGMSVGSWDMCRWTAEVFHKAATGLMMKNCSWSFPGLLFKNSIKTTNNLLPPVGLQSDNNIAKNYSENNVLWLHINVLCGRRDCLS